MWEGSRFSSLYSIYWCQLYMMVILTGGRWYLLELICTSQILTETSAEQSWELGICLRWVLAGEGKWARSNDTQTLGCLFWHIPFSFRTQNSTFCKSAATAAKSLQSCSTLYDPIDSSPPRLPHPWDSPGKNTGVGCHFLRQCLKVKSESEGAQSRPTLVTPWTAAHQLLRPWDFPGKSTGVGCHCLLELKTTKFPSLLNVLRVTKSQP